MSEEEIKGYQELLEKMPRYTSEEIISNANIPPFMPRTLAVLESLQEVAGQCTCSDEAFYAGMP